MSTTSTTAAAPPTVTANVHLSGPFAPLTTEVDVPGLEVVGELPTTDDRPEDDRRERGA